MPREVVRQDLLQLVQLRLSLLQVLWVGAGALHEVHGVLKGLRGGDAVGGLNLPAAHTFLLDGEKVKHHARRLIE
jgi:hypothetical protein